MCYLASHIRVCEVVMVAAVHLFGIKSRRGRGLRQVVVVVVVVVVVIVVVVVVVLSLASLGPRWP